MLFLFRQKFIEGSFWGDRGIIQSRSKLFQTILGSDFENGSIWIGLGYIKWTCLFVFGTLEFLWCNNLELKSRSCWIINTIILILQNKLNFRNLKFPNAQVLLPNTVCFRSISGWTSYSSLTAVDKACWWQIWKSTLYLDLIESTSQFWHQKRNNICRFEWISIFNKFDIA